MNGAIDRYITNIYIITVKIICTMLQDVKNHNEFGEMETSPSVFCFKSKSVPCRRPHFSS